MMQPDGHGRHEGYTASDLVFCGCHGDIHVFLKEGLRMMTRV